MKAEFGAKWAILILVVTVILIIAVVVPYNDAMKGAIETSAYIHANEIAGIINLLQTAPNMTTYDYILPDDMECKVVIGEDVNFTVLSTDEENSFVIDLIRSDLKIVDDNPPDPTQNFPVIRWCETEEGYTELIKFTRYDDKIRIN